MNKQKIPPDHANDMALIEKLSGACTFQDLGRPKAQHLGFSSGGAADEHAFLIANHLLGNPVNSSALELRFAKLTIKGLKPFHFVITGANCEAFVNDNAIELWQSHQLLPNDTLTISLPSSGLINYLAFDFTLAVKQFLGSCSQTTNEMSLNLFAPKLAIGNRLFKRELTAKSKPTAQSEQSEYIKPSPALAVNRQNNTPFFEPRNFYHYTDVGNKPEGQHAGNHVGVNDQASANNPLALRFIPSPQFLALNENEQAQILTTDYIISSDSNRMGYRVTAGTPLSFSEQSLMMFKESKLSKPVCYGTIQLPADNNPIVLMKDRQTIGGYPVLGNVMQTDLFRLAQKRPGERIRFTPTTMEFAQQQLISFRNKWR